MDSGAIAHDTAREVAGELMAGFARRTGLGTAGPQRRYLWTDAFAVCNLLALARRTGDDAPRAQALALVDAVHHTLGRHRPDDPREGWLSGLTGPEAEAHPTLGGLRIGKPLPERAADAPADPRLEWDRDGQYFHYLTRWMHALDQTAWATGDGRFNRWGRELAVRASQAFSYQPAPGSPPGLVWKMSIDLSRPLVQAQGHHDPLDGYLTALELQSSARLLDVRSGPELADAVGLYARMIERADWVTDDPLGLGGLMTDALRVRRLERRGASVPPALLETLLSAARAGLEGLCHQPFWRLPAEHRLAFRELGLAIGLEALRELEDELAAPQQPGATGRAAHLLTLLGPLTGDDGLASDVVGFWLDAPNRVTATFTEHQDINEVMLATALVPDGYLAAGHP